MWKNRPSDETTPLDGTTPAAGESMTADERTRAAGTGDTGVAGDLRVAGSPPEAAGPAYLAGDTAPDIALPDTAPDTAPETTPVTAPEAASNADLGEGRSEGRGEGRAAQDPVAGPVLGRDEVATGFPSPTTPRDGDRASGERLMDPAEAQRFRERWRDVQSGFVDDPAESVRRADALATEVADALARALAARRRELSEPPNAGGDERDTERLRLVLREYRVLVEHICGA